jgi:glycosyltransferase involved in cell wall biosynthesis
MGICLVHQIGEGKNLDSPAVLVVIPAHNEGDNLLHLLPEVAASLDSFPRLRIVVVDDGSTDNTASNLLTLSGVLENLTIISLGERLGKATALARGFEKAVEFKVDIVCMLDGDGQDNPFYLNLMIQKVMCGTELVTGRRVNRAEKRGKRIASKAFNLLVRLVTATPGKDQNSGMKAMNTELTHFLRPFLVADRHRFISLFAHWGGFSLGEISVINRRRLSGKSKYNASRLWSGTVDLLAVWFFLNFSARRGDSERR